MQFAQRTRARIGPIRAAAIGVVLAAGIAWAGSQSAPNGVSIDRDALGTPVGFAESANGNAVFGYLGEVGAADIAASNGVRILGAVPGAVTTAVIVATQAWRMY